MRSNHLAISLTISAPIQRVWDALADWERQGDWMLQTKVWVTSEIQSGVGTRISAFTGVKKLGILDTMEVTAWAPPQLCDVVHTGDFIKGTGRFQLIEIDSTHTRFDWSEEVLAPRPIFILISPALFIGVRISLARFARTFC
ncbi:MAG: SRPBCC family protein [Candidatus Planktophila sp.]|nr:SRPBCC family protein [Candidatus Planktophila sp.]